MTTIDIRQVPKHPSLEAAPAYQGLPHREIRHIPTKILHISGGIYRWWDDHIAPIQMWCFQTKNRIIFGTSFAAKESKTNATWLWLMDKKRQTRWGRISDSKLSHKIQLTNFTLFGDKSRRVYRDSSPENRLDAEKDRNAMRFRLQVQWRCKISNSADFIPKSFQKLATQDQRETSWR